MRLANRFQLGGDDSRAICEAQGAWQAGNRNGYLTTKLFLQSTCPSRRHTSATQFVIRVFNRSVILQQDHFFCAW